MNRFTLAFDDARLEREFLDEYADSARGQVRAMWIVAIMATAVVSVLDPDDERAFVARVVRCGLALPAAMLIIGLTYAPLATFRRTWAAAHNAAGCVVLAIPPLTYMAWWRWAPSRLATDDVWTFFNNLIAIVIVILAFHTVATVRFLQATIVTVVFSTIYPPLMSGMGLSNRGVIYCVTFLWWATVLGMVGSYTVEVARRQLFLQRRRLAEEHEKLSQERAKSEALLRNILPSAIAERLKSDPSHIADGFSDVTILFADIVGFTDLSARLSPAEVVAMLNRLFTAFDDLAEKHGLEKIKTIGDAYMVVGGLPEARPDHAEAVVAMALGMRDVVAAVSKETGYSLKVRIGANTGSVVAGVIGKRKFAYDLWGDAVNTASRMESHGLPGEIQVTEATWARVKDAFELESRGTITVKGKGELPAWLVRERKVAQD